MDKSPSPRFTRAECAVQGATSGTSQTVNQSEVFEVAAGVIALSEWEQSPAVASDETPDDEAARDLARARARNTFYLGTKLVDDTCDFLTCHPDVIEILDVELLRARLRRALLLLEA